MGFNVSSYIKESAKTASQRIVDDVTDASFGILPTNVQALAQNIAGAFLNIGASTDTIDTFTRDIADTVISTALEEFRELAGAVTDVATNRNVSSETTNAFLANVNPTTKLASTSELEVIVVV